MPVLAITFDADQTLWDFRAVQKLALRATADEMMRAGDVSSVTPSDLTRAREETVLGRLKPRYKLGLLSNGNTYPDRCGLPGTFDAVVLGPEIGIEKPDPRAFRQIARELGVEPIQTVHIGDDWDDIAGANAVGATSVFLNRNNSAPAFAATADYQISNLDGLEAILEAIGGPSQRKRVR